MNISEMTVPELAQKIEDMRQTAQYIKSQLQSLEAELLTRTISAFTAEMVSREKSHGSISKEIDGVKLTYEVKQTVSWDQNKLRSLWESLPTEIGNNLIKTEFSVSEAVFKNQVDPGLIDALVDARTTKLSTPQIKLNK
jgi:hypothetical protein